MLRHFLNPPNWFTSASLVCSTTALARLLTADTVTPLLLQQACILIVIGGICDLLDGRVARLTRRFTDFGVQLDSIADIVGFGMAPALIVWTWELYLLGPVGLAATVWFVLAAAFRLARFNVDAAQAAPWPYAGHSRGLTSTMAGGILVTTAWVGNGVFAPENPAPWVLCVLVAMLGLLMVSSIPFRTFRDLRRNHVARRLFAVSLFLCLLGGLVIDVSMIFGVGALLYIVVGFFDGLAVLLWADTQPPHAPQI